MKVSYSSLHCPHCGSKSFDLINDDIFICGYCGQKFNFNLEEIDFSSENKIFIEELKEQFNKKISELNYEKKLDYIRLLHYKKLASPKLLPTLSYVFLTLTILIFFYAISNFDFKTVCWLVLTNVLSLSFFVLAKVYKNKKYQKYQPIISIYASNIVSCEEKITAYTNLLSKLTK